MDFQEIENENINLTAETITKAKEGDAGAQLVLGKAYFNATLMKDNRDSAFEWVFCSAEQGNREAQFRLGDLYALGHGTARSGSDAYKWYTKSAIQGYKKALIRLHNLYREDNKMHCRGQINTKEEKWASKRFKSDNKIRELNEYRIEQKKSLLNGAIDYYTDQFKHYQLSSQEDPIIQINLAFLYQHGYGVRKCIRWAFEYYALAADQGNTVAQYNLGDLYEKHTDIKFNYRHAFKWYTESAQGSNRDAQRSLAYFYLKGVATDIDYGVALFWYTKAAKAGDSVAQVTLGKLYRKGDCIKQDLSMAVKWYRLAARQGSIVAQNCLSQLHKRGMLDNIDLEEDMSVYTTEDSMNSRLRTKLSVDVSKSGALYNFNQLSELGKRALIGDGQAMYEIGLAYLNGDKEFNQDQDTGIAWIKNAAYAKHKGARIMIADLYKKGGPVKQDYTKAGVWYQYLAKKKDSNARYNLGIMYNEGLGVRQDPLEASKWFIWASDQGNSDAQFNLGMFRLKGRGLRQDEEDAVYWFYKSVLQKNAQACCTLGDIYFYGRLNITKNTEYGSTLLKFAAKNGNIDAQKKIENIYREGHGIDQFVEKSIECYTIAADSGNSKAQYTLGIRYLHLNDWAKAYDRFKQARDKKYKLAEGMFQTPAQYDPNIKDYSKVLNMFIELTQNKIVDLTFHIGFLYEHGIKYSGKQHIQINHVKARDQYLTASQNGDSRADYRLGIMYENGNGVERSHEKALKYYEKSSRRDNGDASFKLATICFDEYSISPDDLAGGKFNRAHLIQSLLPAYYLYWKASIMGNKNATSVLQAFKKKREGASQDLLKQVAMLEAATEEGFTGLQYELGVMYENQSEDTMAFKWFKLAAQIGVADACYRLGVLYEEGRGTKQDYTLAINMYQKATEKDHEIAYYRLAYLYQYGEGVELDYLKAYHLYKKAADLGYEAAQDVLNITLNHDISPNKYTGETLFDPSSQEYQDTLLMCRCVAEKGNVEVQFKVGFAYEYSVSEPDYIEAHKWYSKAANNSHTEAIYSLGSLYERGAGVRQDYQRAVQLYKQAYQQSSGDALYRLAIAYHHGNGVEVDLKKAIEYYIRSAELGNPKYQCELGSLYEDGEFVEKKLLEAIKWYTQAYLQGYSNISSKLYSMYQDEPYECFFYKKLFRILSIAEHGHFRLNQSYNIDDFGGINNRLGSLYVFGYGIKEDLDTVWGYFSRKYDDHPELTIGNFFILNQRSLSTSQLHAILLIFEDNEAFMNQVGIEEKYNLGMAYYDGVVETQAITKKNEIKSYTIIDDQDQDQGQDHDSLDFDDPAYDTEDYDNSPSQHFLLKQDYSRADAYLKMAADRGHKNALQQLKIMRHDVYDVSKNNPQGEILNFKDVGYSAEVYHTHEGVQNFSKALKYYRMLQRILKEYLDYNDRKKVSQQAYLGFGLLYEYGDGVKQNYHRALRCYKMLTGYCRTLGLHRQGLMNYYGKGIPIDYDKSFELFEKASLNSPWPKKKMVFVYDKYDFLENFSQSHLVYSEMGRYEVIGENHYYLGLMHKNGQGTPIDTVKAQYHFKSAFEKGCNRAKYEIED